MNPSNDFPTLTGFRSDVQVWLEIVRQSFHKYIKADQLGSLTVFGSWTGVGPLYPESDLDLLVVIAPNVRVTTDLLEALSRAVQDCKEQLPYPFVPVIYTFEDLSQLMGAMTLKLYTQTARTIMGIDLKPYFSMWLDRYDNADIEVKRGTLSSLSITMLDVHKAFTLLTFDQAENATNGRAFLMACLRAIRYSYWIIDESQSFPPSHHQVHEALLADPVLASLPNVQDILASVWQKVVMSEQPAHALACQLVSLLDDSLVPLATRRFSMLSGEAQPHVKTHW